MWRDINESDWKLLRKLQPLALERLCQRILDEISAVAADSGSYHERYLVIYKLIHKRDEDIARVFNNPRRSNALLSLTEMRAQNLITDEELSRSRLRPRLPSSSSEAATLDNIGNGLAALGIPCQRSDV